MAMPASHHPIDPGIASHGVLRGTVRAGDSLRLLEKVMAGPRNVTQNRWIIDNRMVRSPLPLVDAAHFAHTVRSNVQNFEDVRLAWVASTPLSARLREMLERLPIGFRAFDDIDDASTWLTLEE